MRKARGMTLLEVELALLLIIVTVGIFLSTSILGGFYLKKAQGLTAATFLAKAKLAEAVAGFEDPTFIMQGNFLPPYDRYWFQVTVATMPQQGSISTILVTVQVPHEMGGSMAQCVGIVENQEVGSK